jgi:hypothetical protein
MGQGETPEAAQGRIPMVNRSAHSRGEGELLDSSGARGGEIFERDKSVISRHPRNVFVQGEVDRESVVAVLATTADDGKVYQVEHFNPDADRYLSPLTRRRDDAQ